MAPTSYIGIGPNGVGWEILNADSTAATVSVQYAFKHNNLTYSTTGQFSLAAWDGNPITVAGTEGGVAYSLKADVVLNTNINDGSVPTNRFNVEVQ